MIIEQTDEEIIIRIPNTIELTGTERIIDYIKYQVTSAKSKATQQDANQLADELNSTWWDKNKDTFLK